MLWIVQFLDYANTEEINLWYWWLNNHTLAWTNHNIHDLVKQKGKEIFWGPETACKKWNSLKRRQCTRLRFCYMNIRTLSQAIANAFHIQIWHNPLTLFINVSIQDISCLIVITTAAPIPPLSCGGQILYRIQALGQYNIAPNRVWPPRHP